jgi:two-component system chemotaxis response regulator CheB
MTQHGNSIVPERGIEAVAVGGSAGAFEVVRAIVSGLTGEPRIPIIVVLHLPSRTSATIHETLQWTSRAPLVLADDKQPFTAGNVYFAPPAYHLLVESSRSAALSVDEPVMYSRPSIDVLFQSASDVYGSKLLGILLSGASADGAEGLQSIQLGGGYTVAQHPDTCESSLMTRSALNLITPDMVLSPAEIASLVCDVACAQ